MLVLFTDFGFEGPYTGQMKAVLYREAPGVAVVDLFADAPAWDPRASAYLLAAFADEFPPGSVFLCVVDPGVGGRRRPLMVAAGGRWYVGPDNGLFEPILRRAGTGRAWEIMARPRRLSATFHGRDLFAPAAAGLARGLAPEALGAVSIDPPRRPDWPDDLAEVVYVDRYGNLMTGLRAALLPAGTALRLGNRVLGRARTFSDVVRGQAFWYENSSGLAEIAVNCGRADQALQAGVGTAVTIVLP